MFETLKKQAEVKWMELISQELVELFRNQWLPSHDIQHHFRVWENACRILPALQDSDPQADEVFYEQLLISCMFHDTGLLIDKSFTHGAASAQFCRRFIENNSSLVNFDVQYLLDAIIRHDEKDYTGSTQISALHKVLTIADDMDAFGAIGAYRYAEIYLLRGLDMNAIPTLVMENARKRYAFMKRQLVNTKEVMKELENNFYLLLSLFQSNDYPDEPTKMLKTIQEEIIEKEESPSVYFSRQIVVSVVDSRLDSLARHYLREEDACLERTKPFL